MKQTAVEWLVETIDEFYGYEVSTRLRNQIKQAEQMEKEQIENAWDNGNQWEWNLSIKNSYEYYNKTFKSE